jgi:uncharacterized membrane protein YsdA (DUF1294 family)
MHYLFLIYLVWILVLSLVTFAIFGWDKRQAGRDGRRISESTLLVLSTVGGWPGALWGSHLFRHKTQKQPFRLWLYLGIMLHVVCVALIAYAIFSRSASAAASVWTPAAGF